MFREIDLVNCLYGLVGWRQNNNPDYPVLPPSVTATDSGLCFQDDLESLVSIENIDQATKNFDRYTYPVWLIGTTYKAGQRVKGSDNKNYESDASDNLGNDPVASPDDWTEVNLLAEKLTQITRAAINKIFNRVFIEKKIIGVTKSIFENIQLFDGAGAMYDLEIKSGRFVGFEIILKSHRNLSSIIRRLGTQFSAANPDLDIYLYHSSQADPVNVFTLALNKVNSFQWSRLTDDNDKDWILRYLDEDLTPGGSFYLGYYEDDLLGQAVNRGYDFANPPGCTSCGNNYRYWAAWSEYLAIQPFEVAAIDINDDQTLWDIRKNRYQWTKNYGLNMDLSVRCDVTDFFCRERTLFTDAIMKQVTYDVLHMLAYSSRDNSIEKITKDLANFELSKKGGATDKLDDSIKAMSFDVSDLNESCLPCNQNGGSTWGQV